MSVNTATIQFLCHFINPKKWKESQTAVCGANQVVNATGTRSKVTCEECKKWLELEDIKILAGESTLEKDFENLGIEVLPIVITENYRFAYEGPKVKVKYAEE